MGLKEANIEFIRPPIKRSSTEGIVVHHLGAKRAAPETIHQWHLDRGWIGAGYNIYIRKDGTEYELRGVENQGAHVKGENHRLLGIALEGNFEKESPTDAQYEALANRIKKLFEVYGEIPVTGHYDHQNTSCPGRYFKWEKLEERMGGDSMEDLKVLERVTIKFEGDNIPAYLIQDGDKTLTVIHVRELEKLGFGFNVDWSEEQGTSIKFEKR